MPSYARLRSLCLLPCLLAALSQAAPKGEDLRLEVARQWEEKGEFDKAVQELRLYLSEHPDNPGPIYARVGGLRLKQGNYKLAGENFKIALAKDPSLTDARAGLALAYEKQGEKAKAEEERKKLAVMAGPGPANPAGTASDAKPMAGDPAKPASGGAADDLPAPPGEASAPAAHPAAAPEAGAGFSPSLDSASARGPEGIYADKDFLAAIEFYKAGKLEAMGAPLRRCLARHPGHPGAYYLGGVMRYDKGEYSKALFNFKRALDYPERGNNAHFYMGRIYQRQERLPQAAAEYREYLKATRSEAGRKQAEAYLAQLGEGNLPATPKEGAEAPAEAGSRAGESRKPGAAGAKTAPPLRESTAKEAAHEAPHEAAREEGHREAAEKPGAKPRAAPERAAPAAPKTPVPPSEAKALVLGRDGGFLFLIPDPESPSGKKLREAHALVKNDRFEKAAGALKEVMLGYGGSDNALAAGLDLASVYLQLGLWDQARERAADHLGPSPGDSAKYRDAAQYLAALAGLGMRDGEKAEKALLKIKPGAPDGPSQEEVDYRLAQAGALLQDPKKWSGYLEKGYANAKDPVRKAEYARDLGGLHAKYGSLDKAATWYGKAAGDCRDAKDSILASLCAETRLRLADLAYRKKDWKGAMSLYRQFAAQWPAHKESAWVHYQMANLHKMTGNFESALNEYKRVIDNYPESYWASQAKWKREDAIWRKEYEEVLD